MQWRNDFPEKSRLWAIQRAVYGAKDGNVPLCDDPPYKSPCERITRESVGSLHPSGISTLEWSADTLDLEVATSTRCSRPSVSELNLRCATGEHHEASCAIANVLSTTDEKISSSASSLLE